MNTPQPFEDSVRRDRALDALFAAARKERPDTSRAEYGFETRLLARLSGERSRQGGWMDFGGWCWRLVPAFAVITLATGLWTLWPGAVASADDPVFSAAGQPLFADEDDLTRWLTAEWLAPI